MEILFSTELEMGKEGRISIGHKSVVGICISFMYLLNEMRKSAL